MTFLKKQTLYESDCFTIFNDLFIGSRKLLLTPLIQQNKVIPMQWASTTIPKRESGFLTIR